MRFQWHIAFALFETVAVLAAPSWSALQEYESNLPKVISSKPSSRPNHPMGPKHPGKPMPSSPPRVKYCYVNSHGNGQDDSNYILEALHECNNGGHVVFSQGIQYTIGTALNMTFLKHIDLGIGTAFGVDFPYGR